MNKCIGARQKTSGWIIDIDLHSLLTGDVVFDSEVSFLHPEWPFGFDIDAPMGTKARMAFLDRAAADKTLVGSYHLPFPGFGHVVREEGGYRWLPEDWEWKS